jgi:hypothetical protein
MTRNHEGDAAGLEAQAILLFCASGKGRRFGGPERLDVDGPEVVGFLRVGDLADYD